MDYWQIWQILTWGICDESSWGASSGAFVSLLAAQQRCSSPCFIFFWGKAFCKGQFFSPDMYNLVFPNGTLFFNFRRKYFIHSTMIWDFVLGKRLIAFVTYNARYFVLGCSGKLTDKLMNSEVQNNPDQGANGELSQQRSLRVWVEWGFTILTHWLKWT